jgi:hypothetical protein
VVLAGFFLSVAVLSLFAFAVSFAASFAAAYEY